MEGVADASFLYTETPTRERLVDRMLAVLAETGLSAAGDSDVAPQNTTIEFDDDEVARTRFYWRETKRPIRLTFRFEPDAVPEPSLRIACNPDYLGGTDVDGTDYTGFTGIYIDLLRELSAELEPMCACSRHADPHTDASPEEVWPTAPSFELERIPWLGIYSASLLDRFGWTDRIHDAPAWRVEQLPTGAVMLIKTREPWANVSRDHPLDRFLLDGEDSANESGDDLDLADPFAALDVDEYGADVCLHRNDIARSFPNEDLRLIRVEVDEKRNLRRVDTGAFVRNVVDADPGDDADLVGRMLSDIPADATDADLHVSALFHAAVPPAFVRLDGPDDENLVTKVMALDLNVSKVELLITFGRVAQHDDFTQENLDSMEGAMDTLAQVDADAATQYVRENFL